MEQPQTTPTEANWVEPASEPEGQAGGQRDGEGARERDGGASGRLGGDDEASRPYGGERWSAGYGAPRPPPRAGLDFSALFALLDALRRAAPAEAQGRLTAFIREALLTLRSLIDWYLDRMEAKPREPHVEDIPID